ncbi:carboxy-S-adenosyl-L-methionine synthase CmoA [Hahella sp. CCB-MM4]|uniref:carboxy-S-adenosyl-L-methionine synthase CmoA n=1 Tax=Hahella sp. (strain CCB-MM4) TaxID=1926491 RepID=UPI000B9B29DF|nr:carboxy-S-adenosyl-L-methionine synthase CmoA [Hahella sp. CCB-MM4]OZG73824.1 carboxy-S-adenosyl-L-methionine synthase CmoA [Hahella sp. CCB-MM4]
MTDHQDQIYANPLEQVKSFVFDERVAHVFTDMINRSVPGYAMTLEMLGVITQRFAQPGSALYDLGCSLGASTLAMRCKLDEVVAGAAADYKMIGIDNSEAMIERCRVNLARVPSPVPTELICQGLEETPIDNASMVVLNFTLQFIPIADRLPLLKRIAKGTRSGGALVLSEKIVFDNQEDQDLMTDLHHDFKRSRGYSDLEIAQKRAAIENVLVPETIDAHLSRLKEAGYSRALVWYQCFNFVSFLAIR